MFLKFHLGLAFLLLHLEILHATSLNNCPMPTVKRIIQRTIELVGEDAPLQMQLIRKILEDIYGGTWGVLIVKNAELVSTAVHWTIPDHKHVDGSPAFCLHVEKNWQYNVFKTGNVDTSNRVTVEDVVQRLKKTDFQLPTITEFDQEVVRNLQRRTSKKKSRIS